MSEAPEDHHLAASPPAPASAPGPLVLDATFKEAYYRLYEQHRTHLYVPALTALVHNLSTLLDAKFHVAQRMRCRVEVGRIKDSNRLLLKAQAEKYHGRIISPPDVFSVIKDIVGTRVTCNTLSDVDNVVTLMKTAATRESPSKPIVRTVEAWEDDYIRAPKESGYRAVNLLIGVPVARGDEFEIITCEVQVRTLLQHAWGELTHEDTYKPGVPVPRLVQVLSKRLATALAVLDEIAQDLRTELDKLEQQAPPPTAQSADDPLETNAARGANATQDAKNINTDDGSSLTMPASGGATPTAAVVRSGFEAAFGKLPLLGNQALEVALERLRTHRVENADQLEAALRKTDDDIRELERRFDVNLNDLGRISYALRLNSNYTEGIQKLSDFLSDVGSKRSEFQVLFPIGREFLGTVLFSNEQYALVQLLDDRRGILRASEIKSHPNDYIEVSDHVQQGDTLRVFVKDVDVDRERVTLTIDDRERRKLGFDVGG